MKSQKFKRIIVLLLVTAMAVAIPGSLAKYVGNQSFMMSVKKDVISWSWNSTNTTLSSARLDDHLVLLPYEGKYAIMVKGGDGANGFAWAANQEKHSRDSEESIGGTVVGIYVTTKTNQYLYVAPGYAGKTQTLNNYGNASAGIGGNNALSLFGGGKGGVVANDNFMDSLANAFSKQPAGGGGGAASVVYQCDKNGNYADGDLLFIAGGGGGSPGWNQGYESTPISFIVSTGSYSCPPGHGGYGGRNYSTISGYSVSESESVEEGNVVLSIVNNGYGKRSFTVYYGDNGTGSEVSNDGGSSIHYGRGGTIEPGIGGVAAVSCAGLMGASAGATNGMNFASNGTGGNGDYYGGGGGGGYCGGGGGNGTSIDVPAGGGGGGSSCYTSLIIPAENANIFSNMIANAAGLPNQEHPVQQSRATSYGNGYVIIKYLGKGGTPGELNDSISLEDILDKITLICKSYPNKKNIGNTSASDSLYKALIADSDAMLLLSGRAWRVNTDANGLSTLEFTNTKSANIGYNAKFWKYNSNGTWQTGTGSYTYPSKYSSSATGFVLN